MQRRKKRLLAEEIWAKGSAGFVFHILAYSRCLPDYLKLLRTGNCSYSISEQIHKPGSKINT